jgi:hypothetical protein
MVAGNEESSLEGVVMSTARDVEAIRTGTDSRGRAVPMTVKDALLRGRQVAKALDALDDMGDAEEQRATLEALKRGLDREENRLSHRKRFC